VELLEQRWMPTAYTVTTARDILADTTPGEVTLRDVLTALHTGAASGQAAAPGATNSIAFAIGAAGSAETITLSHTLGALPTIVRQVDIEGLTQGGASYAGSPLIVLNGANTGSGTNGLDFEAGSDQSRVIGLVIQRFARSGLVLHGTSGITVQSNFIGTNRPGTAALGNALAGIVLENGANSNTIGGAAAGAGNLISGNGGDGIELLGAATTGNLILGNQIGTDLHGTAKVANIGNGIDARQAGANTVGGSAVGAANVISGNRGNGVLLDGASQFLIKGNRIGTDINGSANLGNAADGIRMANGATQNTVGGVTIGSPNTIAFNAKGVVIGASANDSMTTGNLVQGNAVFANAGLGIDLGNDGATPNGANPRSFPNNGQNTPILTAIGATSVSGSLTSAPGTYRVEFFASPVTSMPAQAATFLGFTTVTVPAAGSTTFTANGLTISGGVVVTATATSNATGDTSEFTNTTNYVVTTTKDVLGDTAPGEVTLRDVLTALHTSAPSGNAPAPGLQNTISFAIGGRGSLQTITLSTALGALPTIPREVFINGLSQGGTAYHGAPLIVLSGAGLGVNANGLDFEAGSDRSALVGLVLQRFSLNGLVLNATSSDLVQDNYIGTNAAGTSAAANQFDGILIVGGATNNTIGGTSPGTGNVLSGNGHAVTNPGVPTQLTGIGTGIEITGNGTTGNIILGNRIGSDVHGTGRLGNVAQGILIAGSASANTIGGIAPGAANVISGNGVTLTSGHSAALGVGTGIEINGSGTSLNSVLGNLIGTTIQGNKALANTPGDGILISSGATDNAIGGTASGAGNVISGNNGDGIGLFDAGTSGNTIQGNLIGTDIHGVAGLGNAFGIEMNGATSNVIGGAATGAGNVISANRRDGIFLANAVANNSIIQGNKIGTDITGTVSVGNHQNGIEIVSGESGNTVGGTAPGDGNLISGNGFYGIEIGNLFPQDNGAARGNIVQGNMIGTDVTGTAKLGNKLGGIYVEGDATGTLIGGATAGAGNLISGNGGDGVSLGGAVINDSVVAGSGDLGNAGRNVTGNTVLGNKIGTDITGRGDLANSGNGITVANNSTGNLVGGTTAGTGNTIAFNAAGVVIGVSAADIGTKNNTIEGNSIFANHGVGIDLGNNGRSANGGTFPNDSQNAPVLTVVTSTSVSGTLTSAPGTYRVELFASPTAGPTFQGKTFLGFTTVTVPAAGSQTFTVNSLTIALGTTVTATATNTSTGDTSEFGRLPPTVYVITTTRDVLHDTVAGEVTLRDVLTALSTGAASGNAGAPTAFNTISFAIGKAGSPQTISVLSALPAIKHLAFIDGFTQGGAGYHGMPLITIDGTRDPAMDDGLHFSVGSDGSVVRGLAIGHFGGNGIVLDGVKAVVVAGNRIGTDATGTGRADNLGDGVLIENASTDNTVGGATAADGNLISGNDAQGIEITGAAATHNVIEGSFIGTDVTGRVALPNQINGVLLVNGTGNNRVGTDGDGANDTGERNLISGNANDGVRILGGSNNIVAGNYLGTDLRGLAAIPNGSAGLSILAGAQHNRVGAALSDAAPANDRNIVAGNRKSGVLVQDANTTSNVVAGNFIGTTAAGNARLGNGTDGILIANGAANNSIGDTAAATANVIAGNGQNGVEINGTGTSGNVVRGNFIGTDATAILTLGNARAGILVSGGATNNTVGGTLAGSSNAIAFNAKGVVVIGNTTTGDSILGNRIFANASLGIDLGNDGVTANGANPRTFPNNGQNAPVLTTITTTSVSGSLTTGAGTYRVEIFASPPTPLHQGKTFLGFTTVTQTAAGTKAFTVTGLTIPAGMTITATATNATTGDTSEFA
jgi:hypothetical protein